RMGGLRRTMPWTAAAFTIGAASLAALPLVTAGFWSKEAVLGAAWEADVMLWAVAAAGALITAVYAFRLVFLVFAGEPATDKAERPSPVMHGPVAVLAVFSLVGAAFGAPAIGGGHAMHWIPAVGSSALVLLGIGLAWWAFGRGDRRPASGALIEVLKSGFGIDALYRVSIVAPFSRLARWNRNDAVDRAVTGAFVDSSVVMCQLLGALQTGRVRSYALGIVVGAVVLVGLGIWTWD
ncbi:MAG: proton-conducting transporter transmembrane domain-containing protein, partial [Candidatus Wenzhouxiangella sp. M2_3B_020]